MAIPLASMVKSFWSKPREFPIVTQTQLFKFNQAGEALIALKTDAIRGAGVLDIALP